MSRRFFVSGLMATALIATALTATGCKKEEKAQEAPAPAQQVPAVATAPVAAYDFESGTSGWKPNAKTVKLEQATDQKHSGSAALKISGTAGNPLWNFAVTPTFNLEPGKKYKLSGWMYADSWDNNKFAPLLKVSIAKDNKWDSNAFTSKYQVKNMKQWQEVTATFVAPQGGALTGYIAMEKATKDPISAVIYLDDIKLEPAQ